MIVVCCLHAVWSDWIKKQYKCVMCNLIKCVTLPCLSQWSQSNQAWKRALIRPSLSQANLWHWNVKIKAAVPLWHIFSSRTQLQLPTWTSHLAPSRSPIYPQRILAITLALSQSVEWTPRQAVCIQLQLWVCFTIPLRKPVKNVICALWILWKGFLASLVPVFW